MSPAWSLLATASAGLAVWAWWPPRARRWQARGRAWSPPSWAVAAPGAIPPGRRGAAASLAAAAVVMCLGWTPAAWVAAPLVLASAFVVLGRLVPASVVRRREEILTGLPQVCDLLAVTLESGLPLRSATRVLADVLPGPLGEALAGVDTRVSLGADESAAWRELATEPGLEALGLEVARTVGSGIALARVLRGLAVDARREAQAAAEVRAKRVGVLSVLPLMLCYLPAFVLLGVVPIIGGIVQRLVG